MMRDHRLKISEIAKVAGISAEIVFHILNVDLRKHKFSAKWMDITSKPVRMKV